MGVDIVALITRWEPVVAAYRAARGLDFYWDADDHELPYAIERDAMGGFSFVTAGWYFEFLLPFLPDNLRSSVSPFLDLVYGQDIPDDLSEDAGGPKDSHTLYAMRPATARLAHARGEAVPWDALYETATRTVVPEMANDEYTPDIGHAMIPTDRQRDWIAEAAATDRGIVVIISY